MKNPRPGSRKILPEFTEGAAYSISFLTYLKEAFVARPWGLAIPPNFFFLGMAGLLGMLNPGIWLLGAGVELGYLLLLGSHRGFQKWVDARHTGPVAAARQMKLGTILSQLDEEDRQTYRKLEEICERILLQHSKKTTDSDLTLQSVGLGRLLGVLLNLLVASHAIRTLLRADSADLQRLEERMAELEGKLVGANDTRLKESLAAQKEVLKKRLTTIEMAVEREKLIKSEINRIEQQIQLVFDEVRLAIAPGDVTRYVSRLSDQVQDSARWVQGQTTLFGEDSLDAWVQPISEYNEVKKNKPEQSILS